MPRIFVHTDRNGFTVVRSEVESFLRRERGVGFPASMLRAAANSSDYTRFEEIGRPTTKKAVVVEEMWWKIQQSDDDSKGACAMFRVIRSSPPSYSCKTGLLETSTSKHPGVARFIVSHSASNFPDSDNSYITREHSCAHRLLQVGRETGCVILP